ncbi:MAG: bifunctional heptose 7-phosphate kinase/heptose 1-phosphate adenyltransferase [Bryobacteraceae bacterium]
MTTAEILARFPKLSALVVGDICLDRWCTYDPAASEPSRETGIPRIAVVATEVTPGAGGTVCNNLAALGCGRIEALGVVGDDGFGYELLRAMRERGVGTQRMLCEPGLPTFTYTKLINRQTGIEDQPRVDFINQRPLPEAIERKLLRALEEAFPQFDVILVADQAETGQAAVVTPAMRALLAQLAQRRPEKVVWADSRLRIHEFRKVIVKPNQQEADAACLRLFGEVDYQRLRAHVESPVVIVTRGGEGVIVINDAGQTPVPTRKIEKPVDICGAGDSFSAGAALALAVTRDPIAAARFGNLVASVTIMKRGTGTASPQEVLAAEQAWRS